MCINLMSLMLLASTGILWIPKKTRVRRTSGYCAFNISRCLSNFMHFMLGVYFVDDKIIKLVIIAV